MILFSLGLPSAFADWCDGVVAELATTLGPIDVVAANRVEEFTRAAIASTSPYLVVASRRIGRLQRSLEEADRPFVIAVDEPRRAVHYLVADFGVDFWEATRLVASSCASAVACLGLPRALPLPVDAAADPTAAVVAIARHLEIPVTESAAADLAGRLSSIGRLPRKEGYEGWWEGLSDRQRAIIAGAIDPYGERFAGGELGAITWERDLFLIDGDPEERAAASRPVDITGRPRFLIYGPYIALPPGPWSATIALGFSEGARENSYIVDVVADRPLANVRIEPGNQSSAEVDLHFSINEPLDDPIVIRIMNERAAFDGRLALGYAAVSRHPYLRPEIQDYFDSVFAR